MSNNTQSKFETGRTYSVTSIGDQNCRWTYTVVRRTAKSVWLIDDDGKVSMFRIRVWVTTQCRQRCALATCGSRLGN